MAPICFCLFVHRDSWCPACLPVLASVRLCCRDLKKKKRRRSWVWACRLCTVYFKIYIWFHAEQISRLLKQGWIFITLVILCLQAEASFSLQTDGNHSSRGFPRPRVARENSRREDDVGVCLVLSLSTNTHRPFSKHSEACMCAHMCYGNRFCCCEPLKAPCFSLGGFSCRQVDSGEWLQRHQKHKLIYAAF